MTINVFPHETTEYVTFDVTLDGALVTSGIQVSVVPEGTRPTVWTTPAIVNGKTAVLITGLTAGTWHIWARASSNPEFAILDCGYILLT